MKTPRPCSDRAMTSCCVRFDDRRGCSFRINKTNLRSPMGKHLFSYYVKRYEQVYRGKPEISVLKKFERFRGVSERFPPLTPLPVGFEDLVQQEKQSTLKQLVSEQMDAAERIYLQFQGVDNQANYPDDMQVGNGPDSASGGVVNTLGSVRNEGSPGVPPRFSLGLGSCTLNQLDSPEGRPPPSSRQCQFPELNQIMSALECRASKFPDMLLEFVSLKQEFVLYENKLKDREMNELLSLKSRNNLLRRSPGIPSRLPKSILAEDPQNQFSKASMEDWGFQNAGFQDVGFRGSFHPGSDFGVKEIETPMLHDEEDGLLRNRSISEALESVPRLTGRLKKNVGDIRPAVCGGSAVGDLPSKPIMEGFSPQASDLQVNELCSGGENFVITSNPGGNNTLQSVAIDRFVSAEPSADELGQWAERWLRQFDMPVEDIPGWEYLWTSPVRHVSIDTLPA